MNPLLADLVPNDNLNSHNAVDSSATQGDGPFARANAIATADVLSWLSIETEERGGKLLCSCPGCQEPGALVVDAGTKCLHNRCAHRGPPGCPGLMSSVDIVAEVRSIPAREAVDLLAARFGFEGFKEREARAPVEDFEAKYANQFAELDGDAVPEDPEGGGTRKEPSVAKRFRLLDRAQLWEPLPEPVYVVDGIIRQASVVEIAAYGGSAKTWMGIDAVLSVAAGAPWLGRFRTLQGPACFVDYESGQYEILRRLQAVAGARGLDSIDGLDVATLPDIYMPDPAFGAAVTELAQGRSLIVLDTLKAASPGTDENDSNMRAGLDTLRRAAEATGCAFLVPVHSKKTPSTGAVDAREMGRGSSAIHDAADAVFYLEYREGHPQRCRQTKARLGRTVDPFDVTVRDTDEGVLVEAHDVAEEATTDSFDAKCRKLLELVKDNPGASGRLLREKCGMRPATALAALESLERAGAIENRGATKAAAWHCVATTDTTTHWSNDL